MQIIISTNLRGVPLLYYSWVGMRAVESLVLLEPVAAHIVVVVVVVVRHRIVRSRVCD